MVTDPVTRPVTPPGKGRGLYAHAAEFLKYTSCSAIALVLDYAVYWSLVAQFGFGIAPAATIGYSCGLALAYVLLSRGVFSTRWLAGRRGIEITLFVISGLLGLALTFITAITFERFVSTNVHAAKIAAIIVSFVSVYLFRKFLVFRPPLPPEEQRPS